jgi:pyruvate formate lyase activating enzyme
MNQPAESATECALQEAGPDGTVRCRTCSRRCVIAEGGTGWCRTRTVRNARLYSLTCGRVSSLSANPIEKKPLFHFYPGSYALTAGSWGCNFACPWCQNWDISKRLSGDDRVVTPAEFVDHCVRLGCQGTSLSFNEPTLSLEWAIGVFRDARNRYPALYHTFVTNGYMTSAALRMLADAGLDAMNVDVKGGPAAYRRYCRADDEHVWATCVLARKLGLHIEIATLVIPGVNDTAVQLRAITSRVLSELGPDVPWHANAYHPACEFDAPPTPRSTMERALSAGKAAGLHFVYVGNMAGFDAHTYCPTCGRLLVERSLGRATRCRVAADGTCPGCGERLPGKGWAWGRGGATVGS